MSESRAFPKELTTTGGPPPPPPMPPPPPPPPPPGALGGGDKKKGGISLRTRVSQISWEPRKWKSNKPRADCGFVGLANQGATCYMNSLLQSLYMTPELRSLLYGWTYCEEVDGPKGDSIPYQLQTLFGRLALSHCEAVDTTDLTSSFGWHGNQAFEQHDVQELCRVLFEALDKSFLHRALLNADGDGEGGADDGDNEQTLVSEMFEGVTTGYIDCQSCPYVSERHEKFQDLQVPVRGHDALVSSLKAYVTPERMEGDNQYHCSGCDQRVDALKGVSIKQLPYLLALQLTRFDFDYMTMTRVKVHDHMTFPQFLDMRPFLAVDASTPLVEGDAPLQYQLFSILIHAGGAMGGHYYAYIYSFEHGAWFNFNDTKVAPCSTEMLANIGLEEAAAEVRAVAEATRGEEKKEGGEKEGEEKAGAEKNEGVGTATTSSGHETSATAYMLMYRRVDEVQNMAEVPLERLPAHCVELAATENEEFAAHMKEVQRKLDTLKLRVYYGEESPMLHVHKEETLGTALGMARAELEIGEDVPADCVRFRAYNPFTKTPGENYEDQGDKTLGELGFPAIKSVLMEVRAPDEPFPEELEDSIMVRVATLADPTVTSIVENDCAENFFTPLQEMEIKKRTTMAEFRGLLAPLLDLDANAMRVVLVNLARGLSGIVDLDDDAPVVAGAGLLNGDVVYAEPCSDPAAPSMVVERFEYEQNLMEVCFNLPTEEDVPAQQIQYDQVVIFDSRKSLRELKAEGIAPLLGLAVDEFKLCRNLLSKEYKDENLSLAECGIFDGSAIYVQLGAPMEASEHKLRFFLYRPDIEDDAQRFTGLVCELILDETMLVDDVRKALVSKIASLEWEETGKKATEQRQLCEDIVGGVYHARLRERVANRAGRVLLGSKSLIENLPRIKDRQEIAIQCITDETKTQEGQIVVRVQQWMPETWSPGAQCEMTFDAEATVAEIRRIIADTAGIPFDCLLCAKPLLSTTRDDMPDVVLDLQWHVRDMALVSESPWCLRDGSLILYKDSRHQANVPQEVLDRRPRERALRIHTRYDDDAPSLSSPTEGGDGDAAAAAASDGDGDAASDGDGDGDE